ncbi:MAG: DUF2179 domain-containing protein [Acidobacteriota bacterium]
MHEFLNSTLYVWGVLPVLIFLTRIVDVSLSTLRIIFINRNLRYYAAVSGFFEVLIWLLVIREIFQRLDNPFCFLAYAAGFATGNFIGILIENKISIGKVLIRIITRHRADDLVAALKSSGYGLTYVDAEGTTGPVKVIFTIAERKDIPFIAETIQRHNPRAFYSVEDVRFVSEAVTKHRLPVPHRWSHFHSRMRSKV